MFLGKIYADAELDCVVKRADGSHREAKLSGGRLDTDRCEKQLIASMPFWQGLYAKLKRSKALPFGMTLAAFIHYMHSHDANGLSQALVTTAGINVLAANFLTSASPLIYSFNYADSGTGVTAAAIGDTALQTQAGPATRLAGTQSTPVAGSYRSVGTISYVSTLAITEYGLFSQAAQGGSLWDHRVFSAINVLSGDSITFTYTCTFTAGGS